MNPYQKFAAGAFFITLATIVIYVAFHYAVQWYRYDTMPYTRTSNEVIILGKYTPWYGNFIELSGTWKKEYGPWVHTRNTKSLVVPELFLDYVKIGEVIMPGDLSIHDFIRQRIIDKNK